MIFIKKFKDKGPYHGCRSRIRHIVEFTENTLKNIFFSKVVIGIAIYSNLILKNLSKESNIFLSRKF